MALHYHLALTHADYLPDKEPGVFRTFKEAKGALISEINTRAAMLEPDEQAFRNEGDEYDPDTDQRVSTELYAIASQLELNELESDFIVITVPPDDQIWTVHHCHIKTCKVGA